MSGEHCHCCCPSFCPCALVAVPMTAHQASTVGGAVEAAVLEGLGTLVEVVAYGREKPKVCESTRVEDMAAGQSALACNTLLCLQALAAATWLFALTLCESLGLSGLQAEHSQFVQLEVTLYNCKVNASIPTPECEQQVLRKVLGQLLKSAQVAQQLQAAGEWVDRIKAGPSCPYLSTAQAQLEQRLTSPCLSAAGIEHLEISNIAQRQPPPRPVKPSATAAAAQPFVPWHLDRIDQHHLPLDHKFNATADGTGTHVYIVSTGILATHSEFGYLGGTGGLSRVEPEWGYMGT